LVLLLGLFFLGWYVVKQVLIPIFLGILTAYVFYGLYGWLKSKIKNETLSALIMTLLILLLILAAIGLIIGSLLSQGLDIYNQFRALDLRAIAETALPDFLVDSELVATTLDSLNSFIARGLTDFINIIPDLILQLPVLMLHLFVFLFTFFFALRDGKLALIYARSLSPLKSEIEESFFKSFRQVTKSVLLGQIVIGIMQGIISGIGFFIFGVPNALVLTLLTMLVGVIPIIGPWLVWVPVDIYLFGAGRTFAAMGLLIYGLIVISWLDTLIRPIIISKGTKVNSAIVIIGMIGGLFAFGILGLIIGPLVLTYILLVFEIYRKKNSQVNIIFQETD
jgi:predicted PurR-regulated permease PerM